MGKELLYLFPGQRVEENCKVTKVRFDDETGEDMYDVVHKENPALVRGSLTHSYLLELCRSMDALVYSGPALISFLKFL